MTSRISHVSVDAGNAYAQPPTDGTRDEGVERLIGLGAQVLADRRRPDGAGWVTFAAPEGNEFDVVRSDAERVPGPI